MKPIIKNGKLYECDIQGTVMQNGIEIEAEGKLVEQIHSQVEDLYPEFFSEMMNNVRNQYYGMSLFGY